MKPKGIIKNSNHSRESKASKVNNTVTWGKVELFYVDGVSIVSDIPVHTSKEKQEMRKEEEKEYFGDIDISGLQPSRRKSLREEGADISLVVSSYEDLYNLSAKVGGLGVQTEGEVRLLRRKRGGSGSVNLDVMHEDTTSGMSTNHSIVTLTGR